MKYAGFKYGSEKYGKSLRVSESSTVSDNRNSFLSMMLGNQLSVSDLVSISRVTLLSLFETVTASDAFDRSAAFVRSAIETVTASDAVSKSVSIIKNEAASVSDSIARAASLFRSVSESVSVSDSWFAYLNGLRA